MIASIPNQQHAIAPRGPAPSAPARPLDDVHDEVVTLTQQLVQVDSGPDNLVAGENRTCDIMESYARSAELDVDRFQTVNGKPCLIVSLPGTDPTLGSVGFIHHSDVVGVEGKWNLGGPFSGKITRDEQGREVLVGRGSLDTKGPAAQILAAMKYLKQSARTPARTTKLFIFPDEETGGKEGALWVSRNAPQKLSDVRYWLVEGGAILSHETFAFKTSQDMPYLSVAQRYPMWTQMTLKTPTSPTEAVSKTLDAMKRLDRWADKIQWTYLGDKAETREMFRRLGKFVGGVKGWIIRHGWRFKMVRNMLGPSQAAANKSDYSKTDMYLSNNTAGSASNANIKPSSASVVFRLDFKSADERAAALERLRRAAGSDLAVETVGAPDGEAIRLYLPQGNEHSPSHGSQSDRKHDSIDVLNRGIERVQKSFRHAGLADRLQIVDYYTSKSDHTPSTTAHDPVTTQVMLDVRVAIDDDRQKIMQQIKDAVGPEFDFKSFDTDAASAAHVRRLSSKSPLFHAAEQSLKEVFGTDLPLFGNTPGANDSRYLQDVNPHSETLAFAPIMSTRHGAHAPDECTTVETLKKGVDWNVAMLGHLSTAPDR